MMVCCKTAKSQAAFKTPGVKDGRYDELVKGCPNMSTFSIGRPDVASPLLKMRAIFGVLRSGRLLCKFAITL